MIPQLNRNQKKRGAVEVAELMGMFWKLAFVMFIFGSIALVVLQLSSLAFEAGSVEASAIAHRIVTGKGGVSFYDPLSSRVYPFEIHTEQFLEPSQMQSLDALLVQGTVEQWAGRITLVQGKNLVGTTYFNKDKYDLWSPQGDAYQSAEARRTKGAIQRFDFVFPVAIYDGETPQAGELIISLYHPRGLEG